MAARFLFTFSVQMQAVVIGWRMYDLTKDPLKLGLIGLVEAIPALTLALYAGYLVDRTKPLRAFQLVMITSFASSIVLLVSQSSLSTQVDYQVQLLYLSSFVTGIARAFAQPSLYSAVPRMVQRDLLPKASAWMSSTMQTSRVIGPAVGGVLYGWIGVFHSAAAICIGISFGIFCLLLIRQKIPAPIVQKTSSIKKELFEGVVFVFKHPILFPALTLDMISVLFGGVTALLPIYAAEILHVGSHGLGLLRGAPAAGALIASIWLTQRKFSHGAGRMLFIGVTGFGVSILVFAISHNFSLSLVALALSGAFDSVSMVIRSAAVQLASPDKMRGRISSVNTIFIGSSNELGQFESGIAATLLGTVPSAVFGGVVCLATVLVTAVLCPNLRKMNLDKIKA